MFDEHLDDSEDDINEAELLLPRRETKQQAELRRSNASKRRRVALGCACNILNGTLGPGMLVLPLAFRRTGLMVGVALLVVDWALSYLALRLLLDACAHTPASWLKRPRWPLLRPRGQSEGGTRCRHAPPKLPGAEVTSSSRPAASCATRGDLFPARRRLTSLVQLARAHGPRMSMFVDWSVVLYFYGTCISYLILVGGTFDHLLHYYSEARAATGHEGLHEGLHEHLHEHGRALRQIVEHVVEASAPPPPPHSWPPALQYGPVQYGLPHHTMAEVACLACDANETYHGNASTVKAASPPSPTHPDHLLECHGAPPPPPVAATAGFGSDGAR